MLKKSNLSPAGYSLGTAIVFPARSDHPFLPLNFIRQPQRNSCPSLRFGSGYSLWKEKKCGQRRNSKSYLGFKSADHLRLRLEKENRCKSWSRTGNRDFMSNNIQNYVQSKATCVKIQMKRISRFTYGRAWQFDLASERPGGSRSGRRLAKVDVRIAKIHCRLSYDCTLLDSSSSSSSCEKSNEKWKLTAGQEVKMKAESNAPKRGTAESYDLSGWRRAKPGAELILILRVCGKEVDEDEQRRESALLDAMKGGTIFVPSSEDWLACGSMPYQATFSTAVEAIIERSTAVGTGSKKPEWRKQHLIHQSSVTAGDPTAELQRILLEFGGFWPEKDNSANAAE
ncbi:hypothetical protein C8R45DRAFT_921934 [Mycena sanguinolenta]|nr:hypothetical protein C8R45DRAFT_921934 [Mycena sanguinolenta]